MERFERHYRVGELAKQSGVPASTLRDWYKQGFIGIRTSEGGHRLFSDRDLKWVLRAREFTQGRYMTLELANSISSIVETDGQPVKLGELPPLGVPVQDPNYRRMLDLASQNARLFAEQRELADRLAQVASDLAATQEAYKSALERIRECLWSAEVQPSGDWSFRLCTPAIQKITGFPPEDFLTNADRWFQIVHPDHQARIRAALDRAVKGETIEHEYRIVRADGVVRWVHNSVQPSVDSVSGRVTRLDGVVADVTERKLAELSLRASELKLRVAVESFPDTVFTLDKDLRYTSVLNPQYELTVDGIVGSTVWDIVAEDEAAVIHQIRKTVLDTGEPARAVVSITMRGKTWYHDTVVSALRDANGEIEGVITYDRDVTDQILREQELRRSVEELQAALAAREAEDQSSN